VDEADVVGHADQGSRLADHVGEAECPDVTLDDGGSEADLDKLGRGCGFRQAEGGP